MQVQRPLQNPLVGASIGPGVAPIEDFLRLKLGNVILAQLPDSREEAIAAMKLCREKQIYVMLPEIVHRHNHQRWYAPSLSKQDLEDAVAAAGEYFLGRYAIGEAGGILYWPKFYTINEAAKKYRNMPPCESNEEARRVYVEYLRKELEFERNTVCNAPLFNVDSSIVFGYHTEAGIDGQCLEMLPGDPFITLAAVRGAARAADQVWGVHIAMLWYGGVRLDEAWLKRWRTSLYISYMAGAEFIYPESGHYQYFHRDEPDYGFDSPEIRQVRDELRKLYRLSLIHKRPVSGPQVPLAMVRGQNDGHPGIWNPYAWGIYECGEKWETSDEERGWELFNTLYTREPVFHPTAVGQFDTTGNPPAGNVDMVPAEGDFSKYKCLIFTGVNTMDDALYQKLVSYVEAGGHLLIWLTHFGISRPRGEDTVLYNQGDLSRLCGFMVKGRAKTDVRGLSIFRASRVKGYDIPHRNAVYDPLYNSRVTGAELELKDTNVEVLAGLSDELRNKTENVAASPLLVEHRLGRGVVHTVTVFDAPGAVGLRDFANTLIWTEVRSHTPSFDLIGGDRIRYAIYDFMGGQKFYLYNTDTDLIQGAVILKDRKKSGQIALEPGEFRIGYLMDDLVFLPEDPVSDGFRERKDEYCFVTMAQKIRIRNLSSASRSASVNGIPFTAGAGEELSLDCPANIPVELAPFFDAEFLQEPEVQMSDLSTPY